MSPVPVDAPRRRVRVSIAGTEVDVPEGATVLDACRRAGVDVPTLCWLETLTPVNVCRVCVVEVPGNRTLVPACSRSVEDGMEVLPDSERVRTSRRMVLELLASSVDLARAEPRLLALLDEYGADPERHGSDRATVAQPVKREDELYVRDYSRCVLCYKCVEACGEDAQHTFAIAVAGRGFDAHIATEFAIALPESACVYCGNCVGVCPTGALLPTREFDLRETGTWAPERQTVTRTVCPYCGVGCNLELHQQDDRIFKVTSPQDHDVTRGHLCVKGRFGFEFAQPDPS
ncbi:MAG: 2Fe-2S iron-sulfur cluster-binding protein [Acidimicrobiales bacterium]|nr:2Fe-2S iron-sulfur cluster-binding protein [Acidimicrobiales bacterium]